MVSTDDAQEAENKAKKHRLEADSFVLEGDQKRRGHNHEAILIEVKRIKTNIKRLEAELQSQEAEAQKLEREMAQADDEMRHLKKELNAL